MLKRLPILFIVALTLFFFSGKAKASETVRHDVTLYEDGELRQCVTTSRTVAEFLEDENVTLHEKDDINISLDDSLHQGMVIRIHRGFYVNVLIDQQLERVKVGPKYAVGNMIASLKRETGMDYYYDGPLNVPLSPECEVVLQTSRRTEYVITEAIPYSSEFIETSNLADGVEETVSLGSEGVKHIYVSAVIENGVEVSREIVRELIVKEPVDHIVWRGVGNLLETSEGNFKYVNEFTMSATAYHAGYESTGKRPGDRGYGITASGIPVSHGVVSVDPDVIPLGTRLYVEGYGVSIAGDTGGGINGMKIDLFYESLAVCRSFGRRNVKVYVLAD